MTLILIVTDLEYFLFSNTMFRSICCSPCRAKQSRWAGVADARGSSQQLLFKLCFCLYKTRCKYCEGFYDINPCCFRLKSVSSIILRSNHALGANHHLRNQILALIMGLTLASLSLKLLGRRLSLTSTTSCWLVQAWQDFTAPGKSTDALEEN